MTTVHLSLPEKIRPVTWNWHVRKSRDNLARPQVNFSAIAEDRLDSLLQLNRWEQDGLEVTDGQKERHADLAKDALCNYFYEYGQGCDTEQFEAAIGYFLSRDVNILELVRKNRGGADDSRPVSPQKVVEVYALTSEVEAALGVGRIVFSEVERLREYQNARPPILATTAELDQ